MHLGYEGYLKKAKDVMETSRKLQKEINAIPGLTVVSNPDLSVFAFTSDTLDIFEVGDALSAQGWYLDRIQFPNGLHVTVSNHNVPQADNFLTAIRQAVETVTQNKLSGISSHFLVSFVKGLSHILPEGWFKKLSSAASGLLSKKDDKKHGMSAAMYGITAGIENRENVHDLVLNVPDKMY